MIMKTVELTLERIFTLSGGALKGLRSIFSQSVSSSWGNWDVVGLPLNVRVVLGNGETRRHLQLAERIVVYYVLNN